MWPSRHTPVVPDDAVVLLARPGTTEAANSTTTVIQPAGSLVARRRRFLRKNGLLAVRIQTSPPPSGLPPGRPLGQPTAREPRRGRLAEQPLPDVAVGGRDLPELVEEVQHGQIRQGDLAGDRTDATRPKRRHQHQDTRDQVVGGLLQRGPLPVGHGAKQQSNPSRDLADLKGWPKLHANRKPRHDTAVQWCDPTATEPSPTGDPSRLTATWAALSAACRSLRSDAAAARGHERRRWDAIHPEGVMRRVPRRAMVAEMSLIAC